MAALASSPQMKPPEAAALPAEVWQSAQSDSSAAIAVQQCCNAVDGAVEDGGALRRGSSSCRSIDRAETAALAHSSDDMFTLRGQGIQYSIHASTLPAKFHTDSEGIQQRQHSARMSKLMHTSPDKTGALAVTSHVAYCVGLKVRKRKRPIQNEELEKRSAENQAEGVQM
eukprot:3996986-Amphidinium_carterae.1